MVDWWRGITFWNAAECLTELARDYPLPRTSPNATPVIDILKAFSLNCLVGGTRFAHCRRLQDDTAVAKITGMHKAGCAVKMHSVDSVRSSRCRAG